MTDIIEKYFGGIFGSIAEFLQGGLELRLGGVF
jgi:hypothetical protein